jgi:hypothetical protein
MENNDHYGILASITWSSTGWTKPFTAEDWKRSGYGHVREHRTAAEDLNFGQEIYPAEKNGSYIGYSPMFKRRPKSQDVRAVFFVSSDYRQNKRKCIVGVYAWPEFGDFDRRAKHGLFKDYSYGNIRAQVEDIVFFTEPVVIDASSVIKHKLLPAGKQIADRGFNYLTIDNVVNILRLAARLNFQNTKLRNLFARLTGEEVEEGLGGLVDAPDAGSLGGIADLEAKMRTMKPEQKERVSTYIERGYIATLVKKHTGYRCLLCEAMRLNPIGFLKPNGQPYVEAHHVDQVANLAVGALGLANIITLCANHHRQMHYGNVQLLSSTKTQFKFRVDGREFVIKKIKV